LHTLAAAAQIILAAAAAARWPTVPWSACAWTEAVFRHNITEAMGTAAHGLFVCPYTW